MHWITVTQRFVWLGLLVLLAVSTASSQELLTNGDFSQGFAEWTPYASEWCNSLRSVTIVPVDPPFSQVLEAESHEWAGCGSGSGASQVLDVAVSSYSSLVLSADVKAISASVVYGCGVAGQEFPIRLDLEYVDAASQVRYLDLGFYFGGGSCGYPVPSAEWTFYTTRVPQNEWFHFTSPNLKNLIPGGSRITKLYVQGNGWAYVGRADNVSLVGARPTVSNLAASPNLVAVNAGVTLSATLSDIGGSLEAADYNINDSAPALLSTATGASYPLSAAIPAFTAAGVYNICVRARSTAGVVGPYECLLLPVYNPNGGFVSGGGWINSPAGAFAAQPSLTGRATFGFVSKYQNGATVPSGDTQFKFHVANLDFRSTAYEWMVIGGARAQFKGSGTINGVGSYQFMLTAIDGDLPGGGGVDRFRIKIFGAGGVVYDNQMGMGDSAEPTTAVGGGNIVIHK